MRLMAIYGRKFVIRYGVAILSALVALALRLAATPLLGNSEVPFITFFPAVAFSALVGGWRAGLLTSFLGALAGNYFFIVPHSSFALEQKDLVQTIFFLAMGGFISWAVSERGRLENLLEKVKTESELKTRAVRAALRESEEKSRLAQRFTKVGIWEWDLETGKIEWSEGVYDLLGIKPDKMDASVTNWTNFILPEDIENEEAKLQQWINDGSEEFYTEFRLKRPGDGAIIWVAVQGQIIRDSAAASSKAVRLVGVNYNITERKAAELKIKKLNHELNVRIKELETIFEIAPVGIAVAQDASCDVISANPALAKILGIAAGDNISLNPVNAPNVPYKHFRGGRELSPDDLPMQRAVAGKQTIHGDETDILRADGKLITIYSYAAPVLDAEGNVVSCIAAHIDATERRKIELERERRFDLEQSLRREAEEANRLKDEFLATVSHELRTPLNSILGWISMLRTEDFLDAETKKHAVEAIERGAKSQSQLIEDLLDVSRIISGKLRLNAEPLELPPVINAAIETVRPAAEAKGVELHAVLSPEAGLVLGDAERLQQIVWNLLTNAVKFTPKGGRVEIALLRNDEQQAEIIVSDTGKGIGSDFLPFVFDRFRQADGSITRHFSGLGLGLAIVRHLTELHGGTVTVESEGEDKGSIFTVYLPSMKAADEKEDVKFDAAQSFRAQPLPAFDGWRILIVDDEENTREILKMVFESCRAEVETAAFALEALEKVQAWRPQIIVSDIGMPDEDGYVFMRKIRDWETKTNGSAPVFAVALTAYARAEDRAQALEAGFQVHVPKPVEPIELVQLIKRHLP